MAQVVYQVQIRKEDGTMAGPYGVLCEDSVPGNGDAASQAIAAAMAEVGGQNNVTQFCNLASVISIDATAPAKK